MQQLGKCPGVLCLPSNQQHTPSGQVHVRESETTNTGRRRPRNRFSGERINCS